MSSNLPDSSGGIFPHGGGGWDLNNAPPLLIQIATRLDTVARDHNILVQEVTGVKQELRTFDRELSTTKNSLIQTGDGGKRQGERIGAIEATLASLKAELEISRRALEDSGYSLRTLTEKFAALDRRDDQQARELKAMREWQVQAIAVGGFVVLLLSIFGPKFLAALVDGG